MSSAASNISHLVDKLVNEYQRGILQYNQFIRRVTLLEANLSRVESHTNVSVTDIPSLNDTNSMSSCTSKFDLAVGYYMFAVIGLLCMLLIGFLTERNDNPGILHWTFRKLGLTVSERRFGLGVPICFWQRRGSRLAHSVAFGATMFTGWTLFTGERLVKWTASDSTAQRVIDIFLKIVLMFIFGLMYYPMFAGAAMTSQPIGYFIGLVVTVSIAVFLSFYVEHCSNPDFREGAVSSPHLGIVFTCLAILTCYFIAMLVRMFLKRNLGPDAAAVTGFFRSASAPSHGHVRRLLVPGNVWLRRKRDKALELAKSNIVKRLLLKFWYPDDIFQFSTGYLSALMIGVVGISIIFSYIMYNLTSILNEFEMAFHNAKKVRELFNILRHFLSAGFSLAFVVIMVSIPVAMGTYRRDVLRLYRGDRRRLPPLGTGLDQGSAFIKFVGYQGAFLIAGFAWLILILGIACFLASIILWYAIYIDIVILKYVSILVVPPIVSTITFIILLNLVVWQLFIPKNDKEKKEDEEEEKTGDDIEETASQEDERLLKKKPRQIVVEFLRIRLLHFFSYLMVFYFMMLGIISAIVRIIISIIINLLHVFRLDSPVTPPMWMILDTGYQLYSNYIQVEVAHSHPALVTFLDVLQLVEQEKGELSDAYQLKMEQENALKHQSSFTGVHMSKAKRRWLLAYTLTRNPELVELRKHFIQSCSRANSQPSWIKVRSVNSLSQDQGETFGRGQVESFAVYKCQPRDTDAVEELDSSAAVMKTQEAEMSTKAAAHTSCSQIESHVYNTRVWSSSVC